MAEQPDVLFVVLDSLRKDHVSTYGYDRRTTPALDTLARESTVYENAYAPAPWTLPSHCSMFTGVYPTEHGVTNGFTDTDLTLPSDRDTFVETLAGRGYRTAGYSNNPWVGQLSGLNRGFDRFVEWNLEVSRGSHAVRKRDAVYDRCHSLLGHANRQPLVLLKRRFFTSNLVDRACRWLAEEDGPTFTFLNLMEAHSPYYPPASSFERLGLDSPSPVESRLLNTKLLANVMGKRELDADERRRVYDFCDASIRYQDSQVERLLSTLRETGRYDETLIIVCADHGKTLGEFDRDSLPPHYLREINVNVPLLVKPPGRTEGRRVSDPVELTDLFEVVTGEHRRPEPRETALVEDYIPHTGTESTDVTRWRAVTDGSRTLVRSDDDDEYVLEGDGPAETARPAANVDDERLAAARDRLNDRVAGIEGRATRTQQSADTDLESGLESQLQDLGYL